MERAARTLYSKSSMIVTRAGLVAFTIFFSVDRPMQHGTLKYQLTIKLHNTAAYPVILCTCIV